MTNVKTEKLEKELRRILTKFGVSPALSGYDFVIEAVRMFWQKPKNEKFCMTHTYDKIAEMTNLGTRGHVERGIRTAINSVFSNNTSHANDALIIDIFGDNTFLTSHISNSAFIASLAVYIRTNVS